MRFKSLFNVYIPYLKYIDLNDYVVLFTFEILYRENNNMKNVKSGYIIKINTGRKNNIKDS